MRKIKLLIAACALLVSAGVQAQKDVTSQYITNATLSSLDGWTNVNFNNPVQGNNTTGYACEAYAGWNDLTLTNFSLTQTITLPAGHYTLVNYSFYRYGLSYNTDASKSLAYLKAGDNQEPIKTLGSITAAGYANSQAEGANCFDSKMYRNTLDFTIDADNTSIEIGVTGTHELKQSWMILGMFELIDNDTEATMDAPFDVTGYITNPGFEYRDMTGWTLDPSGSFGTQNNDQSFKVGAYYAEKWQPSTDGALTARSMSQTLTGLPAGYYKLTANVGGNGTYLDLNGKTVSWTEDKDYTVGYVLSENESLTITAGKTADGTANWIHFDNFKLYFCGDVQAALTTLLEKVGDYDGKIPATAYNTLTTNVNNYNKNYSDVDELLAAIDAVQDLYDAADQLVEPYATAKELLEESTALTTGYQNLQTLLSNYTAAVETFTTVGQLTELNTNLTKANAIFTEWISMKQKAETLADVANDNAEANSTLGNAITTQEANVQAVNAVDAENLAIVTTAIAKVKAAMTTYVGAANPVGDGAQFDCTFLMTNPDLTGLATWKPAAGWASEESDGNSQVMVNDSKTQGDKSYFYEYWSNPAKASGNFALYNAVTLPAGTFSMSCYAFAEDQYTSSTVDGVYFYANDTQGSCVTATVLTQQTLSFVNSEEQEVKIGLKTLSGNTRNWMGIGYVQLYKVPAQSYTVDEDVAWDNTQEGAGAVTLNRTIKEGVNTLVLPFSMTQAEVEEYFGEGSKVYVVKEYKADTNTLSFTAYDGISANKPCLLQATEAGTSYELDNRAIVAGEPEDAVASVSMIGTYAASSNAPLGSYIISGGMIYNVDSDVTLKNTRAYLLMETGEGVRTITMTLDDETTGIITLENGELKVETGTIYDLSGRKVLNPTKGIYVVNGKKVMK